MTAMAGMIVWNYYANSNDSVDNNVVQFHYGVSEFFGMYLQIRSEIEDVQQKMLLIYNNVNDMRIQQIQQIQYIQQNYVSMTVNLINNQKENNNIDIDKV